LAVLRRALHDELVLKGSNGLDVGLGNEVASARGSGLTLQADELAGLLRLIALKVVLLHTLNELAAGSGGLHVLNANVNALGKVLVANALVDNEAKGVGGNIVNAASLTVVDLVGHTLVIGRVCLNVNKITSAINLEVGSHANLAMLPEGTLEHMAGMRPVTVRVRHF